MNRLLGLLSAVGISAVTFVGCSGLTPSNGDGDGDGGGNGGTGSGQCNGAGQMMCGTLCANVAFDALPISNGNCICAPGLLACGTGCINPVSDPMNCGNCGVVCPSTAAYCLGAQGCQATCPGTVCSNACVNLVSDQTNCGACGNACLNGTQCLNAQCTCPANTQLCGTSCVPTGTCNVGTGGTTGLGGTTGVGGTPITGGTAGVGVGGTAGVGTGGTPITGGTGGVGGTAPTGGTGGVISGNPPGWWTHATWHGCPWTGIDVIPMTTTTNMPRDFVNHMPNTGYCVSGTVYQNYDSVALLGFNLNETPTGSATQCAYNPAAANMMGPPGVTLGGTGIAVNWSKSVGSVLRIQVQGPNGQDPNSRWCSTITAATSPTFVPYTAFNTKCWDGTGTTFNPSTPISAISFLVPGALTPTPFNYCINGFATGTQASDAPSWGTGGGGPLTGTIGGPGAMDIDFQRVKVAKDGKSYIIQNNNWGNPNGSDQTLTYRDNSFKVTQSTGSGSQAPASFPSIFIGGNGDVQGGTFSTRSDDHLPKQISGITSLMSTFTHTGTSGQLNATYDIWFSDHTPTGRYDDAISGFIMLWLYDPNGASPPQPIGSNMRTANLGGRMWNVWVGPRGDTGAMCETVRCSANRPVVSYVAQATTGSFSGDLKPFFADAAQNGIPANWYLTDVFAGFECWTGQDCVNKEVTAFTASVLP